MLMQFMLLNTLALVVVAISLMVTVSTICRKEQKEDEYEMVCSSVEQCSGNCVLRLQGNCQTLRPNAKRGDKPRLVFEHKENHA